MARIDWVVAKLNNWALWVQAEASGGGGYPTQSVLLANPVDTTREIDMRSTVDNVEALLTDKAVSSLRVDHAQIHRTLVCIYIEDRGVPGTAAQISRSVPRVHHNLERGDELLRNWFNRHAESQDAIKRGLQAVQTSAQK
jgi:hypothetical protein